MAVTPRLLDTRNWLAHWRSCFFLPVLFFHPIHSSQSAQTAQAEGDLLVCRQMRRKSPVCLGSLGQLAGTGSNEQDLTCADQFWVSGRRGGVIVTSTTSWATPVRNCESPY